MIPSAASPLWIVRSPSSGFAWEFQCRKMALEWFLECGGKVELLLGEELVMQKGIL